MMKYVKYALAALAVIEAASRAYNQYAKAKESWARPIKKDESRKIIVISRRVRA